MANIYKEQQRALNYLKRILEKIPKTGMNRNMLVMEILTAYATSEGTLQKYITTMIEVGQLREEDGTLYAAKK
jgi:hypothetical protein